MGDRFIVTTGDEVEYVLEWLYSLGYCFRTMKEIYGDEYEKYKHTYKSNDTWEEMNEFMHKTLKHYKTLAIVIYPPNRIGYSADHVYNEFTESNREELEYNGYTEYKGKDYLRKPKLNRI